MGMTTDLHDFQILPNGNALMVSYPVRPGTTDLSPYVGPSQNTTLIDSEIQEVTPNGTLVWSWNTKDHIPLSETGQRWWTLFPFTDLPDGRRAYDYAHINSIQQVGGTSSPRSATSMLCTQSTRRPRRLPTSSAERPVPSP